ncbi:MAG: sulfotransferase [Flavobacteriales bacterium]
MGSEEFAEVNRRRNPAYQKDERSEGFLEGLNRNLYEREKAEYQDHPIEHPFIFVVGAPRSGTTLLTQVIGHGLDVSYIDNLAARFFLAPLHGMRFSRSVFGKEKRTDFRSDRAATYDLADIHEFGYFWREWLNKKRFDDITYSKEREAGIEREGLRKVLASMQCEAGRGMVFKNIFGSYHMPLLKELLDKVLFIHIRREEMDTALSILKARKEYQRDLRDWWSYQPLEYEALKERDPYEQIAGQVHCLRRFYKRELSTLPEEAVLEVEHETLCKSPSSELERIRRKVEMAGGSRLSTERDLPESFSYRHYEGMEEEKDRFRAAFDKIRTEFPL